MVRYKIEQSKTASLSSSCWQAVLKQCSVKPLPRADCSMPNERILTDVFDSKSVEGRGGTIFFDRDAHPRTNFNYPK